MGLVWQKRLDGPLSVGAVAAALVVAVLVLVSGFNIAWDFLNYHYYDAFALFHDRSRDIAPAGLHTFFNPAAEIPFYLAANFLPWCLTGALFGLFSGLNITLAYLASRTALGGPRGPMLAALCAVFAAGSTNFAIELSSVNHDNLVSLFLLAGLMPLLRLPHSRHVLVHVAVAGFVIGMGVGLKYTLAPFLVGAGAFLPLLLRGRFGFARIATATAVFAGFALAGALVTAGWWMLHLWQTYGNPFFPMFNGIFHSPYAAPESYADHRFLPRGLMERLAFPFFFARDAARAGVKLPVHDYRYVAAFVGFIAAGVVYAVQRLKRLPAEVPATLMPRNVAWFLIGLTVLAYVIWEMAFSVSRYLLPLDLLLPLVGLAVLQVLGFTSLRFVAAWGAGFLLLTVTASHPWHGEFRWDSHLLAVDLPAIAHPDESMVLLAGTAPLSYLIPAFPQQIPFVRISLEDGFGAAASGGITAIDSSAILARRARDAVRSHRGDLYVLFGVTEGTRKTEGAIVGETLRRLSLRMLPSSCRAVVPSLRYEHQSFWLCGLARV